MRQTSATEHAEPLSLADTILEALDLTMQGDIYNSVPLSQVIDDDDSDDGNDDGNGGDEVYMRFVMKRLTLMITLLYKSNL